MAAVDLTIALESVRDLLMELGHELQLLGLRDELEELGNELKRMKLFVESAYARQEEKMHIWEEKIGEVADKVDEIKNLAINVASMKRRSRGILNDLKRLAFIFSNKRKSANKLRSDILNAKTKISNLTSTLDQDSVDEGRQRWERLTFPYSKENIVGMEDDISQLVFHLVNDENQCQVVSICGMGGVGKTALARKAYYHAEVRQCFDLIAWTCLTQQWQQEHILQDILHGFVPGTVEEVMKMDNQDLVLEKIYRIQREKKCLIVIDDIWTIDQWHSLRHVTRGSKVLLTTRDKRVALLADPNGYLHEVNCLSEEESWNLLQRVIRDIGTEFTIDKKIEGLGMEMVRHCMGLPLAIKVLGRILAKKDKPAEWEMVLQDLKTFQLKGNRFGEGNARIFDTRGLSYNNLPYQLKPCFCYFGNFPDNFEIKATRLYHLWIAEGIVWVEDRKVGETMMDVAKRYLSELEQRYIIQVRMKEGLPARRIKSCKLHNRMRDLCLSKSNTNSTKRRGRAIYYNSDNDDVLALANQRAPLVRSLVFFRGGEEFCLKTLPNINNFQSLRVLDLEGVEMNRVNLPESIENLVQLRYLSLRSTSSSMVFLELPSSISNLRYLQILDLRAPFYPLIIPDVLWKLQRLTHLYLPTRTRFDREKGSKLRLGELSNLETLVNFNLDYCHVEDLCRLCNLRKLKIEVWDGYEHMFNLVNKITSLKTLKESKLKIMGFSFRSENELQTLRKLLGCQHLSKLDLRGPISRFPWDDHFSQSSLTELNLWESRLKEDPMPTLKKLPSLFSLHIGRDVFMGIEMVSSPGGFCQLRTLVLVGLPNLVNWEVNEGAFPKLSRVEIHSCMKLEMIPDGLKFVNTLHICIHNMPKEFEFRNKAKVAKGKEVEDIHKVRHNATIKFYNSERPLDRARMEQAG